MTDFLRQLTNGFARKVGYILAALIVYGVLSLVGMGNAKAAGTPCGSGNQDRCYPTREAAYAGCIAEANRADGADSATREYNSPHCEETGLPGYQCNIFIRFLPSPPGGNADSTCSGALGSTYVNNHRWTTGQECPAGLVWDNSSRTCRKDCSNVPPLSATYMISSSAPATFSTCFDSCGYEPDEGAPITSTVVDGQWYTSVTGWSRSSAISCAANGSSNDNFGSPPNDSDADGISDGNDSYPNDSANGSDGSSPPSPPPPEGTCGGANQPPCEKPGDESDNQSSGGGSCDFAPTCSGDGITCGILFQTWKRGCEHNGLLEAQKALTTATNEKLDAIKAFGAAQATASKQDDIRAAIDLSRAQLAQFQAAQVAEAVATNANIVALKTQQASEVTTTNAKIDAFNSLNKQEQDETQAAVDALRVKYSAEVATTNEKLALLNQTSMEALLKMDAPQFTNKIDTTNNWLASIRDEANVREIVRKQDADALKAVTDSMKASIDSMSASLAGKMDTGNGWLGQLKGLLDSILDKLTGANGSGLTVKCPTCPTGGAPTNMDPTNSLLGTIKDFLTGDPGAGDTTGENATAESVSEELNVGEDGLDQSGFGWSRACPAPITVSVFGQTLTFETGPMCSWLALGGWFVMLLTAVACLRAIGNA